MFGLVDPIFPEGNWRLGIGAGRQNRVPRWLVEIQRLNRHYFLSDVPGQLIGVDWPDAVMVSEIGLLPLSEIVWEQGIYSVTDSGREIELVDMSLPLASATIHLTTDIGRFFDPMTQLAQAQVRVSYYDGKRVRRLVRGLTEDNAVGFDGAPSSFRIIEKWRTNPPFPPAKNEKGLRVSESRIIEGSEDQAYMYLLGDAWAAPVDAIRSFGDPEPAPAEEDAEEEEGAEEDPTEAEDEINTEEAGPVRLLLAGHPLTRKKDVSAAGRDPCPYVGFPHPEHPSNKGVKAGTVVGLWYGRNRVLRDPFERVGLARKWEVAQGTFAQNESGATGLEATALDGTSGHATVKWTDWNYEETLSLAIRVEAVDPGSRAIVYWNYVDADNHARVEFPFGGKNIRVVVREAGVDTTDEKKKLGEEEDTEDDLTISATAFKLTVDIRGGRLTAGVKESGSGIDATVLEFGEIGAAVGGRLAIGCREGLVRFLFLSQPSMKPEGQTEADLNAAIRNRKDKLNHPLVCEDYKEQPGEPMFANYNRAQNVDTVGHAVDLLVRHYSNLAAKHIDEFSIRQLVRDLDRIRIGAWFDEQQPVFDLLSERLGKQFCFAVTQEGGFLKGFMFDATRPPERKLVYGVDLLELTEEVREFEKFNSFTVKWKKNAARGNEWGKKDSLDSENFSYFRTHRRRYGNNPFPRDIELPDVVSDGTGQYLLLLFALIFHAGQRAPYLMHATPGGDIPFGQRVLLDDPARGWLDQKAFLVGRSVPEPGYVVNVFRTIENFEEVGSGGASVGVTEPTPEPTEFLESWDMDLLEADELIDSDSF